MVYGCTRRPALPHFVRFPRHVCLSLSPECVSDEQGVHIDEALGKKGTLFIS